MRTVLALVVAAAMIAGALVVRGNRGGDLGPLAPDTPLAIICSTEVAQACRALPEGVQVTVEPAGVTATRLSSADGEAPAGWVTLAPWPQIVAENRQRSGLEPLSTVAPTSLGRSPLVIAVWADRATALAETCGKDFSWTCLGENAGLPWADIGGNSAWGKVKPGHADPSVTADGLLVLGQAVADFVGGPFSARDLDDDAVLAWLTQLERAIPTFGVSGNSPLQQMVQFGKGRFDAVGAVEAEAGPLLARSAARAGDLQLRYPQPLVVATAVLAPLRAGEEERLAEEVGNPLLPALAEAGWRVDGQPNAAGVAADLVLPDDSNLPAAGVLEALRVRTEEITR